MPELPEVETTRRGIAPHLLGRRIVAAHLHDGRLRWPVAPELARTLPGQTVHAVTRRGKYLLLTLDRGELILHLGMSGSLRIAPSDTPRGKYDHIELLLAGGNALRLRDPRRFGAFIWTPIAATHPLIRDLGPEPLGADFTGAYLHERAHGRRRAVKEFIMDARMVVGVGNIYANEALFAAGIHPARAAGRIARPRYERLAVAIAATLERAIAVGGTTLRDFYAADGTSGYFGQELAVYGRGGMPCTRCERPLRMTVLGARSTYFCTACQR